LDVLKVGGAGVRSPLDTMSNLSQGDTPRVESNNVVSYGYSRVTNGKIQPGPKRKTRLSREASSSRHLLAAQKAPFPRCAAVPSKRSWAEVRLQPSWYCASTGNALAA
jgi:hypothetical protein